MKINTELWKLFFPEYSLSFFPLIVCVGRSHFHQFWFTEFILSFQTLLLQFRNCLAWCFALGMWLSRNCKFLIICMWFTQVPLEGTQGKTGLGADPVPEEIPLSRTDKKKIDRWKKAQQRYDSLSWEGKCYLNRTVRFLV